MEEAPRASANLYSILGVDIKATQESIRQQYLKLARTWHPDRHQGPSSDQLYAKRMFQEISAAFGVLSNVKQRHQYDLGLLDLLDVEDYLQRFQGLILTACGLGMSSSFSDDDDCDRTVTDFGLYEAPAPRGGRWCLEMSAA